MAIIRTDRTFLDEMSMGDGEIDDWVDSALTGSRDFVKEFLEIGEESLEFSAAEDELRKLQNKLNDAEYRESQLKQELKLKNARISSLDDALDQLKKELLEERARAKDEAEDMAQEMAELRYQMSEMLEEERMLRARTEQVSVHRVEELEHQVKLAREEAVVALARRREAESKAEKEIGELRAALEETRQELHEAKDALSQQAVCERCPVYLEKAENVKERVSQITAKVQEQEEEILLLKDQLQRSISRELRTSTGAEGMETEETSCDMEARTEERTENMASDSEEHQTELNELQVVETTSRYFESAAEGLEKPSLSTEEQTENMAENDILENSGLSEESGASAREVEAETTEGLEKSSLSTDEVKTMTGDTEDRELETSGSSEELAAIASEDSEAETDEGLENPSLSTDPDLEKSCLNEELETSAGVVEKPAALEFTEECQDIYAGQIDTLEQKIRQLQASEMQLQLERSGLLSDVEELKTQVGHFKRELQASIERHSESLLKLNEERTLLQEETESTRTSLLSEITRLQHVLEGKDIENEMVRKELADYQSNLEKETDRAQELSARIKALEAELQSERVLYSEAASKCVELSHSLDTSTQKLLTVEAELTVSKNDSEGLQTALQAAEDRLLESTRQKHSLEEDLQQLRGQLQIQEQRANRSQQEAVSQRAANNQLANKVGELNSEVLILQQRLITCQTQVSEMAMKNVILEDTVAAKKRKIKEGEQRMILQAEKMGRQEEKYFGLQAKFSALQNDFSALEMKLSETRRKEQEIRIQMERLSLELSMAKQEVVNSEVRLQKAVKHGKEQMDAENARREELVNKHRQTEWFLNKKIEHLERSEMEKEQLEQEVRRLRSNLN